MASTINMLAGALYKVFCASTDQARVEMREACFDYLSIGGVCSRGPVALLSGLNPCPLSLVLHFFAVAIYGFGRLLVPFPSPKRLWIGARLILVCIQETSSYICHFIATFLLVYLPLHCYMSRIFFKRHVFIFQGASAIIFPMIKAEGFKQMFFPTTIPAYYRAPPVK